MHQVTLYTKEGCGLCREALAVLETARSQTPFELVEVDIESADELMKEYGIRIPVVEVDGEEVFEITVDAARLAALLAEA